MFVIHNKWNEISLVLYRIHWCVLALYTRYFPEFHEMMSCIWNVNREPWGNNSSTCWFKITQAQSHHLIIVEFCWAIVVVFIHHDSACKVVFPRVCSWEYIGYMHYNIVYSHNLYFGDFPTISCQLKINNLFPIYFPRLKSVIISLL